MNNRDDSTGDTTKPEHGFDLDAPSSKLPSPGTREAASPQTGKSSRMVPLDPRMAAESRPSGEWRGFEEEEEAEPEVGFSKKGVIEDELDMTPMVDVTFLLLIFFMVTASFTTQKAVSQPPLPTDEPSTNVQDVVDEDQYVEIIIDQYNSYRLTSKDQGEVEAPSDNEMRNRLRDMIKATMAKRVVIKAHANCFHEKVVTAQDAAIDNNIGEVSVQMTEEDFWP